MGVFYETIPDSLKPWILDQKMLWVGTAPLSGDGHINISPKGGQAFGILDERAFWYLDLTGSGVETHAHLHEPNNGRICVMFMAFDGPPRILRIWGTGRPIENGTPEFERHVKDHKVKLVPGARSIIVVDVHQVSTSCGFSVPYYEWKGWRTILDDFFEKKDRKFKEKGREEDSMDSYWASKSQLSIDGLPGMKRGYNYAQQKGIEPLKKMVGKYAPDPKRPRTAAAGNNISLQELAIMALLCAFIGAVVALTVVRPETVRKIQSKEYFL
ncbi:hypothetical protein P280DRAFT_473728 [Massarina eburnea CBS 473.64]|uniref:Pyridoxamine 5'-phosphate oxidase N-terminal domain-containing protein n=1 Tax=Massarina eburnea CBS 473.64 TaxID=1395130 RepID=A0A6A6RK15_9PLEO|nr:hypothetical protein P280DRAFT_473728 [Massarina eburnea CBS 473.64]